MTASSARYFFLSYAHSPPLTGVRSTGFPDEAVREFYRDLERSVSRLATGHGALAPGFIDMEMPIGADWKSEIVAALGGAEVFVPLYSPGYFTKSWPGREWACFQRRMAAAGLPEPRSRFIPVLWVPLPTGDEPWGLDAALELAPAEHAPAYRRNGLLALRRLQPYRAAYDAVVDELARRIVRLVESAPLGPSAVQDIDEVESEFPPGAAAAMFIVVVAAPVFGSAPPGSEPSAYGKSAVDWKPFSSQEVALAEYARVAGEQLDFSVRVSDITAVDEQVFDSGPGVVLIDPWYLARKRGRDTLRKFVLSAPSWVLPLVVEARGAAGADLTRDVRAILRKAFPSVTPRVREGMRGVRTLGEFAGVLPFLVAEASREYLRHGPIQRPTAYTLRRPRLAPGADFREYGVEQNPAKERPDA